MRKIIRGMNKMKIITKLIMYLLIVLVSLGMVYLVILLDIFMTFYVISMIFGVLIIIYIFIIEEESDRN